MGKHTRNNQPGSPTTSTSLGETEQFEAISDRPVYWRDADLTGRAHGKAEPYRAQRGRQEQRNRSEPAGEPGDRWGGGELLGYENEAELPRPKRPPLYAQALGLRYIAPGSLLCFLFFEGGIALGVLGGLTGLVSWWGVVAIPATIAIAVKTNDVVAGGVVRGRERSNI